MVEGVMGDVIKVAAKVGLNGIGLNKLVSDGVKPAKPPDTGANMDDEEVITSGVGLTVASVAV